MKKMISILTILSLVMGCMFALPITSNAATATLQSEDYVVNDVEVLKDEVKKLEKEKGEVKDIRMDIIEQTDPQIYKELQQMVYEEAIEKVTGVTSEVRLSLDKESEPVVKTETIELESGGVVEVELKDEPDTEAIETGSSILNLFCEPVYAVNKAYGNRKYTATFVVKHLLYPDSKLVLATGYKIGNYGLKTRYANTVGTKGIGVVSISSSAWITDDVATGVGADINAKGNYDIHFGPLPSIGITAITANAKLTSYVKLTYINKAKKYADVKQSYKKTGYKFRPFN